MAKIECFALDGVECVFYSNDHGEPHFHAIKADCWEVRVFFLREPEEMIEEKWAQKRRSAKDMNAIREAATQFSLELIEEWESKVQH